MGKTSITGKWYLFLFDLQICMIHIGLSTLNLALATCENEGLYYGTLSSFFLSILELSLLFYRTIFEHSRPICCITIYVQLYLPDLNVEAKCLVLSDFPFKYVHI